MVAVFDQWPNLPCIVLNVAPLSCDVRDPTCFFPSCCYHFLGFERSWHTGLVNIPYVLGLKTIPVQDIGEFGEEACNICLVESNCPPNTGWFWFSKRDVLVPFNEAGEPVFPSALLFKPRRWGRDTKSLGTLICWVHGLLLDISKKKCEMPSSCMLLILPLLLLKRPFLRKVLHRCLIFQILEIFWCCISKLILGSRIKWMLPYTHHYL